MTDTEVDTFLEHFGVKGMHWGIRNAPTGNTTDRQALKRSFEPLTPEARQAFKKSSKAKEARKEALKTGLKAAVPAVLVSAGLAYALYKMRGYGKTPVKSFPTYIPPTEAQLKAHSHGILERSAARIKEAQKPSAEELRLHNKASDIMARRRETQAAYEAYLKKRKIGKYAQPTSLNEVRKALKNPKHVWNL